MKINSNRYQNFSKINFGLVLAIFLAFALSSCAQVEVKRKKQSVYKEADILVDSNPSGADIFIYPQGIIAKTPIYVNRLELENASIDFVKYGYKEKNIFIKKKEKFLPFHTFFGNLILLPLYPFAVISDLKNGWDIEKPAEQIIVKLEEKNE